MESIKDKGKTIWVSTRTWEQLVLFKIDFKVRNLNEVISELIRYKTRQGFK